MVPVWIGWQVYHLFWRDLQYVRRVGKLKTGEVEAMLHRHQRALWSHGTFVVLLSLALFWVLGFASIFVEIPFLLVLGTHLIAFDRFSSGVAIDKRKRKDADMSRLVEKDDFDEEASYTIGDDGEFVEVKEHHHVR